MPRVEPDVVGLLYAEWTENFKVMDWVKFMQSPFEITNLIQAQLTKAGQKGAIVIVRVTLVGPETQDYELPPELAGFGAPEPGEESPEEG